jgi:hypothetical protein
LQGLRQILLIPNRLDLQIELEAFRFSGIAANHAGKVVRYDDPYFDRPWHELFRKCQITARGLVDIHRRTGQAGIAE